MTLKTINQEELNRRIKLHNKYKEHWHYDSISRRLIFINYDFRRMDFSRCNLSSVYIESSDLSDASFFKCNLSKSYICKSKLIGADLSFANIKDARILGCELSGAKWLGSNNGRFRVDTDGTLLKITQNNLNERIKSHETWLINPLTKGNMLDLRGYNLSGMDLSRSNLHNCDLSYSDLSSCDFSGSRLSNSHMIESLLQRTCLHKCDLSYINMKDSWLTNCDLTKSNIRGGVLSNCNLDFCDFSGSDISDMEIDNSNLSNSNLGDVKYNPISDHMSLKVYLISRGAFTDDSFCD